MKKNSIIKTSMGLSVVLMLIGCGGSNSSNEKSIKIKAADAYVVKLVDPAILKIGDKNYTTRNVKDGEVIFQIPKNIEIKSPIFNIPGNAIVDTDGDGNFSVNDQVIRMPLQSVTVNGVANPIGTVSLLKNKITLYNKVKLFDPVLTKKELIKNGEISKLKNMIILNETIANLISEAREKNISITNISKLIDETSFQNIIENKDVNMNTNELTTKLIEKVEEYYSIDVNKIIRKVENEINIINLSSEIYQLAKTKNINNKELSELLKVLEGTVIAVSDSNIDPEKVIDILNDLKIQVENNSQNLETVLENKKNVIKNLIPKDNFVLKELGLKIPDNQQNNSENNATNITEKPQYYYYPIYYPNPAPYVIIPEDYKELNATGEMNSTFGLKVNYINGIEPDTNDEFNITKSHLILNYPSNDFNKNFQVILDALNKKKEQGYFTTTLTLSKDNVPTNTSKEVNITFIIHKIDSTDKNNYLLASMPVKFSKLSNGDFNISSSKEDNLTIYKNSNNEFIKLIVPGTDKTVITNKDTYKINLISIIDKLVNYKNILNQHQKIKEMLVNYTTKPGKYTLYLIIRSGKENLIQNTSKVDFPVAGTEGNYEGNNSIKVNLTIK